MKLHLHSDLHLEFGDHTLAGGDTLLLAGDVCVADYLRPERTDKDALRHAERCKRFFGDECAKYDKVFYIMGNHEHYHGVFDNNEGILRDFLKDTNVTLLVNQFAELTDGWKLFGGTFWTDYNREDWYCVHAAKDMMNDHHVIRKMWEGVERKFTPRQALDEHHRAKLKLMNGLRTDDKVIVMTHHAPHYRSVHPRYHGQLMNGAYYSDQEELILDNPCIKYWFHGHMHDTFDYMVGDHCRVGCNPRGYVGYQVNKEYNPLFEIEL